MTELRSGEERLPRVAHNHESPGSTPGAATSLDGLIAEVVTRDRDWKAGAFLDQADGSWDANGSPLPTPEVQ